MPGRVPNEMVPRYYSLIDITPFPRKHLFACEMVSPIKPLEALAMEKTVLVPDVRALPEMVRDEGSGLLFHNDDVSDLAETLHQMLCNPQLRGPSREAGAPMGAGKTFLLSCCSAHAKRRSRLHQLATLAALASREDS